MSGPTTSLSPAARCSTPPPPPASGVSKYNLFSFFFSKRGAEIMKVETLTCAENWIDCLHIGDKQLIKGNKECLCKELSVESRF